MINAENTLPVFSSTYYINTAHLYMGYFCPAAPAFYTAVSHLRDKHTMSMSIMWSVSSNDGFKGIDITRHF